MIICLFELSESETNLPSCLQKVTKILHISWTYESSCSPFVTNVEEFFFPIFEMTVMYTACVNHPAGRALTSDWSTNDFVMIVCQKFFVRPLGRKFWARKKTQGCARFPEFTQNFSKRQVLWSLCSVDFHTLTLQLPIQTPHSVALELPVFVSSLENCANFRKTSTPLFS